MARNSLWLVDYKTRDEFRYHELHSSYSRTKDFFWLVDSESERAFNPNTEFFIKYWARRHGYDTNTIPVEIPIVWSAAQMALNHAYNQFKGSVADSIRSTIQQVNGVDIVQKAQRFFGEGKRVELKQGVLLSH